MSIFRKSALDALSTPEKLDEPTRLIAPRLWLLLFSFSVFGTIFIIWSIFGKIPVRLSGNGVLIVPGSILRIQSEISGRILEVYTHSGECVLGDTQLAKIDPVDQDLKNSRSKLHLRHLQKQDQIEDKISQKRLSYLRSELNRVKDLVHNGALSVDQYASRQKEYDSLESEILSRNNQREFLITQEKASLTINNQSISKTSIVRSPIDSCIVDSSVYPGKTVQSGETLFVVQDKSALNDLKSVLFFPAKDAKRIKIGQSVKIIPSTSKQQRHGAINSTVVSVATLPITRESALNKLGLSSFLSSVNLDSDQPMIEVVTELTKYPTTYSGYDWGGAPGPSLKLTQGTPTAARVLVEERRPISYLIPLLRDLTSIY